MTQSPPVPLSTLLPRGANQAIRNASAKTSSFTPSSVKSPMYWLRGVVRVAGS